MVAIEEGRLDDAEELFGTGIDNWAVIMISTERPTTEEGIILKAGITVLPFDVDDVIYSAIFRRVDGIKYRDECNIYEYILNNLVPRGNNNALYYILSKYELNADDLEDYSWIDEFDNFEIIQRDVLISQHQIVSLIPTWGEKIQCDVNTYYGLPDGSHLEGFKPRYNDPTDISDFVYAELARRGQKSARS
jgi:hypothetical protein